jgi:hypothetical protein
MNKYTKYFSAIFSGIIGTFITAYFATYLAYKVNGGNLDMAIVQDGIFILAGLIVGCTVFIVATIKENRK